MPAHPKLIGRRERRLLALIQAGASINEASRAVLISKQAVHRHARTDPVFAAKLRAARRPAPVTDPLAPGWMESALWLEREADDWSVSVDPAA